MVLSDDTTDSLLAEFDRTRRSDNGLPDSRGADDRRRCLEVITRVLTHLSRPDAITLSPLGVEWTEVFRVQVTLPVDVQRLTDAGWIPLDRLFCKRQRRRGAGSRWVVTEGGRVLG